MPFATTTSETKMTLTGIGELFMKEDVRGTSVTFATRTSKTRMTWTGVEELLINGNVRGTN